MSAEELINILERWAQPLPECATKDNQYMDGINDTRAFVLNMIQQYKSNKK